MRNFQEDAEMPDVHILWLAGRTVDQKRKVVEGITKVLVDEAGAKPESTHIVFVDIPHTDFASNGSWSRIRIKKPKGEVYFSKAIYRKLKLLQMAFRMRSHHSLVTSHPSLVTDLVNFHALIDGECGEVGRRYVCGIVHGRRGIGCGDGKRIGGRFGAVRVAIAAGACNVDRAVGRECWHVRVRTVLRVIHSLGLGDGYQVGFHTHQADVLGDHHSRARRGFLQRVHVNTDADGGRDQNSEKPKDSLHRKFPSRELYADSNSLNRGACRVCTSRQPLCRTATLGCPLSQSQDCMQLKGPPPGGKAKMYLTGHL